MQSDLCANVHLSPLAFVLGKTHIICTSPTNGKSVVSKMGILQGGLHESCVPSQKKEVLKIKAVAKKCMELQGTQPVGS